MLNFIEASRWTVGGDYLERYPVQEKVEIVSQNLLRNVLVHRIKIENGEVPLGEGAKCHKNVHEKGYPFDQGHEPHYYVAQSEQHSIPLQHVNVLGCKPISPHGG